MPLTFAQQKHLVERLIHRLDLNGDGVVDRFEYMATFLPDEEEDLEREERELMRKRVHAMRKQRETVERLEAEMEGARLRDVRAQRRPIDLGNDW